jgi:aryl-phospho-beta-D-glucosidase BglC (GH1 family)
VAQGQNLLTSRQVDFTTSTGGWVVQNGTLSQVPASKNALLGALILVPGPASKATSAFSGSAQNGGLTPATPGELYSGTGDAQTSGSAQYVQAVVAFLDSSGKQITSVVGEASYIQPGTWTPLVPAIGIAPANAASTVLGVIAWTSQGQETAVESPSLTASAIHGEPAVTGPLTTAGNQILDGNGHPLVLHGVELPGLDGSPSLGSITENTVAQARAWGANIMRVPLGEQYWLPSSCSFNASYASEVDQVVNWITSLGMVAVLDLQDFSVTPCGKAQDYDMANSPGAINFWNSVAARYANNSLVAFDLYNEPHNISDQVWLNGGIASNGLLPYAVAGMQQLYSTVRGAGANNLVIVSGNTWANDLPSTLVSGSNIVYGVHVYTCPGAAPPSCSSPDPYDPSPILQPWVAPSNTVPVMVSEFGWPDNTNHAYNAAVIAFAQAHGWGWNAFAWTLTAPWGLFATDPAGGPNEPTVSGMPVLAALAAST